MTNRIEALTHQPTERTGHDTGRSAGAYRRQPARPGHATHRTDGNMHGHAPLDNSFTGRHGENINNCLRRSRKADRGRAAQQRLPGGRAALARCPFVPNTFFEAGNRKTAGRLAAASLANRSQKRWSSMRCLPFRFVRRLTSADFGRTIRCAQIGPINIRAKFLAAHGAAGGFFDFDAALDWHLANLPLTDGSGRNTEH